MAAVIVTSTAPSEPMGRPTPWSPPRPPLELLPGGRRGARQTARARRAPASRRLAAGVYHRRRLGVALALVTLVAIGYLAVSGLVGLVDGPARSGAAARAVSASSAPAHTYVVQPGDTLWSIARTLRPHGEIRGLVDQLEARAGGASLAAGQRLRLDGLAEWDPLESTCRHASLSIL